VIDLTHPTTVSLKLDVTRNGKAAVVTKPVALG
jgi:hypothetical protein